MCKPNSFNSGRSINTTRSLTHSLARGPTGVGWHSTRHIAIIEQTCPLKPRDHRKQPHTSKIIYETALHNWCPPSGMRRNDCSLTRHARRGRQNCWRHACMTSSTSVRCARDDDDDEWWYVAGRRRCTCSAASFRRLRLVDAAAGEPALALTDATFPVALLAHANHCKHVQVTTPACDDVIVDAKHVCRTICQLACQVKAVR